MQSNWTTPSVLVASIAVVLSTVTFIVTSGQTERAHAQADALSQEQHRLSERLAERDDRISIFSAASAQVPLLFTAGPEREGACRVVVALERMEIGMLPENLASDDRSEPLITGLIDEILDVFDEIRADEGIPNCFAGRRSAPEHVSPEPTQPLPSEISDRHVVFATYTATQCGLAITAAERIGKALATQGVDVELSIFLTQNNNLVVTYDPAPMAHLSDSLLETWLRDLVRAAREIGSEAQSRTDAGTATREDRENLRFLTGTFVFIQEGWQRVEQDSRTMSCTVVEN